MLSFFCWIPTKWKITTMTSEGNEFSHKTHEQLKLRQPGTVFRRISNDTDNVNFFSIRWIQSNNNNDKLAIATQERSPSRHYQLDVYCEVVRYCRLLSSIVSLHRENVMYCQVGIWCGVWTSHHRMTKHQTMEQTIVTRQSAKNKIHNIN